MAYIYKDNYPNIHIYIYIYIYSCVTLLFVFFSVGLLVKEGLLQGKSKNVPQLFR